MAKGKSREAMTGVVWRVVNEDVIHGKGVNIRHREAGEKGEGRVVMVGVCKVCISKIDQNLRFLSPPNSD